MDDFDADSIMISKWPEYKEERNFTKEENEIEIMKEAVRGIRNVRTGMNVPPSKKAAVYVVSDKEEMRKIFEEGKLFFASLASASDVFVQSDKTGIGEDAVSVVIANANIYIPLAELVDLKAEKERLEREQNFIENRRLGRKQNFIKKQKTVLITGRPHSMQPPCFGFRDAVSGAAFMSFFGDCNGNRRKAGKPLQAFSAVKVVFGCL